MMTLNTLHATWHASYLNPPSARCGHICVVVDKTNFGTELIVFHGGVSANKEALDDLSVLQVEQEEWLPLETAMVGPAARAFHAAATLGSHVYIFGGHVYLPEQKRLHQFNDLWALDTDTWQWHRQEASPDAPQPVPRDRASIVAIDGERLLLYGGADASGKRLDDTWIYDLRQSAWRELVVTGAKPRPRCCASLFVVGNRAMVFGGDALGVTNELWSLRGLDGKAPLQWTLLQLDGAVPAPRRGHAAAICDPLGVIIAGGLSEQKSMLGMKKEKDYRMDVVLLQRLKDTMIWRNIEAVSDTTPVAREKHTLCALRDGRLLLFGGTDGTTTLGDAWWLEVEDIAAPPPEQLTSLSDLEHQFSSMKLPPQPQGSPPAATLLQQQATNGAASYWAVLPSSLQGVPSALATAMPSGLTSSLSTLRGKFGLPATGAAENGQGSVVATSSNSTGLIIPNALEDEGLLNIGKMTLGGAQGASEASPEDLAQSARDYFASCSPQDLKLGALPALLTDYRRLARVGWAAALAELGPDGLAAADLALPGRFLHFSADDVRLKDVAAILEDYKVLLAAAGVATEQQSGAPQEAAENSLH